MREREREINRDRDRYRYTKRGGKERMEESDRDIMGNRD